MKKLFSILALILVFCMPAYAVAATEPNTKTIEETTSYESDTIRITIDRWCYAFNRTSLRFFVANVYVNDPAQLHTAFAGEQYSKDNAEATSAIAERHDAILAFNGDYYNYKDKNGLIIRDGVLYRDHATCDALCLFADGSLRVMTESNMNAQDMIDNLGLCDTWSFGPLLVSGGNVAETFHTDVKGKNPRTAFGQRADGSYVAVVVDGRLSGYSEGMTIQELAQYMKDLGCVEAYNLDGGMTSCMYFNGSVISTPCGTANKERSLSDIIYIGGAEA